MSIATKEGYNMRRTRIQNGKWFDRDVASAYEEGTYFDGHNNVSLATGSQWAHETLYRTRGGRWVIEAISGQGDSRCREVSVEEAARWFVANEKDPHPDLAETVASLEV